MTDPGWGCSPLLVFLLLAGTITGLLFGVSTPVAAPIETAPDFSLTLYDTKTGAIGDEAFVLGEHLGRVIVINFWASWCGPCRAEAPALQAVWTRYQDSGEVIVVGVDYVDGTQDALAYLDEFGITYPTGPDLGTRISDAFNIQGVPETYIIGRDGSLVEAIYAGVTEAQLVQSIELALEQ